MVNASDVVVLVFYSISSTFPIRYHLMTNIITMNSKTLYILWKLAFI